VYGNPKFDECSDEQLAKVIEDAHLTGLVSRFEEGLGTKVAASGDALSLGQKQLIAFMRAALRDPEILILDEATANIDTVTEQILDEILDQLPESTTKVIIAHRLNTISNADEIFFVNGGTLTPAGSMEHAVELLLHGKRAS
jgi:ATP-binding cassette subfamily B protein